MKSHLLFKFLSIFLFFSVNQIKGQDCNCSATFDWMVGIFEKNDAGFQYVVDKKGKEDYDKHCAIYREKVKQINKSTECSKVLYGWLAYFRPGHISIQAKAPEKPLPPTNFAEIKEKYKNERTFDSDEIRIKKYLDDKTIKDPIEGIWANESYTIGIIEDSKRQNKFIGFIIKADGVFWTSKQIKVEIDKEDKKYISSYGLRNHTIEKGSAEVLGEHSSILLMNGVYWIKKYPNYILSMYENIFLKTFYSRTPFIEKLSEKTIYLRVPSFLHEQKRTIDSILLKNDKLLSTIPNLIIDIRYGTGGSDASYDGLMKYINTGPIRNVNVQLYATELNALAYEGYAKEFDDTTEIRYCNEVALKMRNNLGKFIDIEPNPYYTDSTTTTLPFPKKIAIICNERNGSTDEQFLIEAKQSSKVKVFGHPTGGMLDISNMNEVDSPDSLFTLGYCMSKSYRIPKFCIDGVGIQPDIFIDDGISLFEWIKFVEEMLEN